MSTNAKQPLKGMSKEAAWDYAIGIVQVEGLKPTAEFLALSEKVKRGEITSEEMDKILSGDYRMIEGDSNA